METRDLVISAIANASGPATPDEVLNDLRAGKDIAFEDLKMDSLSRFEVIMQIEEQLDIELDEDEVLAQKSVFGLAAFVSDRATQV